MSVLSDRLNELGVTYKEYLESAHWADVRKRFYQHNAKQCRVCQTTNDIHLHHRTYKNLGREKMSDLVPLCGAHHDELHRKAKNLHGIEKKTTKFLKQTTKPKRKHPKYMKFHMNSMYRVYSSSKKKNRVFLGIFKTIDLAQKAYDDYHRRPKEKPAIPRNLPAACKKYKDGDGIPCPGCDKTTKILRRPPSFKPKPSKGYWTWWYRCTNKECAVGSIFPRELGVYVPPERKTSPLPPSGEGRNSGRRNCV